MMFGQEWCFSLAIIVTIVANTMGLSGRNCSKHEQCGEKECCAGYLLNKGRGYCVSRVALGKRCRPVILPGLQHCPCEIGLTCSPSSTKHNTDERSKFCCQQLPKPDPASVERYDDTNDVKHV